jgi:hypothetical protein
MRRHARAGSVAGLGLGVVLVLAGGVARAQDRTETITFDDLPLGTVVTTQYSAKGSVVLFHQGVIVQDPMSGGNQVMADSTLATEFDDGPITISFLAPQHAVSFSASYFGTTPPTLPGTLTAFDALGNVVATEGPEMIPGKNLSTTFSVTTNADIIEHVEFMVDTNSNEMIDNLVVTGEPPPTVAGQPVVTITSPPSGITDQTSVTVTGTISGTNLDLPATLTMTFQAPPLQPNQITVPLTLTPTANPTTFQFSAGLSLPFGTDTISVFVQNVVGISGTAQIVLTNLPSNVLGQCGANGPLGAFQFALDLTTCTMNVCANGGVSSQDTAGTFHVLPAAFMTKWLAVDDPRLGGNLGCPLSDAAPPTVPSPPSIRQDFERGRLYDTGNVVSFVPQVFVTAMQVSGEESGVGVPVSDPSINTVALDVDTAWFQHYDRSASPDDLGTTMEIRGNPPFLTVERQGGDLADLTAAPAPFSASTATLWDRFPCTGNGPWTCQVTPPLPHHDPPPSFPAALHLTCSGGNVSLCDPSGVTGACTDTWPVAALTNLLASKAEWVGLPKSDLDPTLIDSDYFDLAGWIKTGGSHMSSEDFPATHSYTRDFNVHVRPFAAFDNILGANFADRDVEIEIEWYYFETFWAYDLPRVGDLFFVNGRWITDCGHNPDPTEIHPPGVIGAMRTEPVFGNPSTYALLTANGFFRGTTETIRINPPPRPSPDAELVALIPDNSGSVVGGISIQTQIAVDHVDVVLSRPTKVTSGTVSALGEMFWPSGVGSYSAVWNLTWQ